ncbi:MAG TPA: DUF5683 domain-containing protein [Bacteroidia bacterium]|nr:DUF5683 domain-containing protein [Bacteroidia bacterium]
MKHHTTDTQQSANGFGLKIAVIRFLCFSCLLLPSFAFSQSVQDSIVSDSLDKAFRRQVISNQAAIGGDTSIYALPEPDTSTIVKVNTLSDSLNAPVLPRAKVNTRMRKFYWNPDKANLDSASRKKYRHRPLYASLFSMALPGLGQAYNRKYWKIPIVYAGFAGLGYAVYYTGSNFIGYRNAYRLQVDEDANTYGEYKGVNNTATLKEYRDYFKKNLDISVICTSVWYILNIVDAAVDAHLFEWNMKDDLSVSWQPTVITGRPEYPQTATGVKLSFNF